MLGDKKLDVYQDRDRLEITLKWFTPIALFLLFFTVIWNAFLVFWYSMAISGGAWIMALFPVLHVAVGVYLAYYTLCLFFNKTFIDISGDYLTIRHTPIPWWKGNRKIPVNAIEQLYVAEKKSSSKNGTQFTYELRAKLYNKNDKDLLSLDNVTSQEVQEIEAYLERFLGIVDEPVKGEYGRKVEVQEEEDSARRHRRDFADPFFAGIYTSREGEVLDLNGEELKLINLVQYDWNDGNSDKYFQLINPDKEERLLYLEQNQALLNAFQEKTLEIFETGMPTFRTEKPPPMIQVMGKDYFLGHIKTGKCFITGVSTFIEVEQWQYHSKDKRSYIRVMNNQGLVSFFQGEKRNQAHFQDALDLDDRPLRDLETREPGWREEDLV